MICIKVAKQISGNKFTKEKISWSRKFLCVNFSVLLADFNSALFSSFFFEMEVLFDLGNMHGDFHCDSEL